MVLPLVIVAAVMVGGKVDIWPNAGETGLMAFSVPDGYFFAIVLISGIVASNAFHPGMWQRVYTIESQRSLNRTLWTAVAIAIPLTFIMALAGVAAVVNGSVAPFQYPDVAAALFSLANDVSPPWLHLLILICALMPAMSTLDTLMNGLASNVASDTSPTRSSRRSLMLPARSTTVTIAVPGFIVASQGHSVLYVFLATDLLGTAIAVPMWTGLYSTHMPGWGVLMAGGMGIAIGTLFYRKPDLLTPWALTAPAVD